MEPLTELLVDGKQKTIRIEENGIAIEFCLLDSTDQPATVFNKGENFKFHLSITNNFRPDSVMYIISDFVRKPDLFVVYKSNNDSVGKPLKAIGCHDIMDVSNQIEQGEKLIIESYWTESQVFEVPWDPDNIRFLQCFFSGLNMAPLDTGKYYTKLSQQFCLGRFVQPPDDVFVCTSLLDLKINFQIK